MPNSQDLDAWLQIHQHLVVKEQEFADIAIRAAGGGVDQESLARARAELMAFRERCSDAYKKAFPPSDTSASGAKRQ